MNWGLIAWFAGAIGTLIGIKFIWTLFRTLFSKESMIRVIDSVGSGASRTSERITENLADKIYERRQKRAEEKEKRKQENKPVVVIR